MFLYAKCWINRPSARRLYYHVYDIDFVNGYSDVFLINMRIRQLQQIAYLTPNNIPVNYQTLGNCEETNWDRGGRTVMGMESIFLDAAKSKGVGFWCVRDSGKRRNIYANTLFSDQPFKADHKLIYEFEKIYIKK